ncbi:MAG TPA: ParB/Srx family N-terminal domain-containing protein [Bryobacteraceae bacterium]|nr:ParB/Srx family N-terminal domain-containing protein [Bryobacteraceae bacterium]
MNVSRRIAASIAEFGFNAPILVDGNAGIIAGHERLLAARKLGLAEVPVVVLDHLSDTQRRAYIIADNKLSELAWWDESLLAQELRELRWTLPSNAISESSVGCPAIVPQQPPSCRKRTPPGTCAE